MQLLRKESKFRIETQIKKNIFCNIFVTGVRCMYMIIFSYSNCAYYLQLCFVIHLLILINLKYRRIGMKLVFNLINYLDYRIMDENFLRINDNEK